MAGKEDVEAFYLKLKGGKAEWMSLHPLMGRLLEEPDISTPEASMSTYLMKFLVALALQEDRSLMEPPRLIHFIMHLKYGAQSFFMVEVNMRQEQGQREDNILHIVHSKPQPPITWSPDMESISIDGENIKLALLQSALQDLIQSLVASILCYSTW
ncbi:hypothetical protein BYT27DRAFT_7208367 [Phlegmacium glaucopus]|nr:hypothetical protein BYT27DRAFT_7208367 [Phlegmacium glaucopus]